MKPPDLPDEPEILSAVGRRRRNAPAKATPSEPREPGAVEVAVAQSIEEIGELPRGLSGLSESALTLARALDEGAGLATAAVARELRATLLELAKDSEGDDGPDPFAAEIAALSQPVPAGLRNRKN